MSGGSGGRPTVFGVLMTRNEVDLLRINVVHHLQTACDRILVVDNGSTDKSPTVLKRLARRLPVEWTRESGSANQAEVVTSLAHEARAKGADWIIPLDTDEFWHSGRKMHDVLADDTDSGAIEVSRIEFIQSRDVMKVTPQAVLTASMRVEHPLRGNEAVADYVATKLSMFETEPQPKVLVRTGSDVEIPRGAHTATGLVGPVTVAKEIAIFHFPLRAKQSVINRFEQGRRHARVTGAADESFQSQYWQKMGSEGRLEEAWRAHSYADGAIDVGGRRVDLIEDDRLIEVVGPWVRSRRAQLVARFTGRTW